MVYGGLPYYGNLTLVTRQEKLRKLVLTPFIHSLIGLHDFAWRLSFECIILSILLWYHCAHLFAVFAPFPFSSLGSPVIAVMQHICCLTFFSSPRPWILWYRDYDQGGFSVIIQYILFNFVCLNYVLLTNCWLLFDLLSFVKLNRNSIL